MGPRPGGVHVFGKIVFVIILIFPPAKGPLTLPQTLEYKGAVVIPLVGSSF